MAILLLSIPHTGTRFAVGFLNSIGVIYQFYHTTHGEIERIDEHINPKLVIPMRDPLLCWMSTWFELEKRGIDVTLQSVIQYYTFMGFLEDKNTHIHLRLDAINKDAELQKVADFCGAKLPISKFEWKNIGVSKDVPGNYELWETISAKLKNKDYILSELAPLREKYGYL